MVRFVMITEMSANRNTKKYDSYATQYMCNRMSKYSVPRVFVNSPLRDKLRGRTVFFPFVQSRKLHDNDRKWIERYFVYRKQQDILLDFEDIYI